MRLVLVRIGMHTWHSECVTKIFMGFLFAFCLHTFSFNLFSVFASYELNKPIFIG